MCTPKAQVTFQGLRHTHATLLLKEGVNVTVVSEWLGHANISITLDTYSHVLPSMQQEAADRIDTALFGTWRGAALSAADSRDRSIRRALMIEDEGKPSMTGYAINGPSRCVTLDNMDAGLFQWLTSHDGPSGNCHCLCDCGPHGFGFVRA